MQEDTLDADRTIVGAVLGCLNTRYGSRLSQAGAVYWVTICGAVLILVIALGTWGAIAKFREREIQRSEGELESRVQLLASLFDNQFEELESLQQSIAAELEQRVQSAEQFRLLVATEGYHRLLLTKSANSKEFVALHIFDGDGNFINSTEQWPVPHLNLADTNYFSGRLELEITEAVLIRNDEAALSLLEQLHTMGVRIALDDFGTGYSSLSYLERFPFDKIKIDRCFVSKLSESGSSSSIVRAVINIAESRQMTTTAEGVETDLQRQALVELGCTEMQGYLFSRPLPAFRVNELLSNHDILATA